MKRLFLIPLLLVAMLSSCSGCSGNSQSNIKHGSTVVVSQRCIGAIDEDSFDKMNKYCVRQDERGLEIMESLGQIAILEEGETGVVTEMGFGKIKIRLLDDREFWCSSEFINE